MKARLINIYKDNIFLVILFFLPIFSIGSVNWQMLFYSLILFIVVIKYKFTIIKKTNFLDFSLFFIFLFSLILSLFNANFYIKDSEKLLLFLSFPLFNFSFYQSKKDTIFKIFVYIGFVYELFFLFSLFNSNIKITEFNIKDFTINNFFHSTYLCIFFAIVILGCIKIKEKINIVLFYLIIVISLIGQFYTFAKMPFFATLLVLICYIFSSKKNRFLLLFSPIILYLFLNYTSYFNMLSDIFSLIISKNLGTLDYQNYSSFTSQHIRNCIYYSSFSAIKSNIIGYGLSNAQLVLNSYLYTFDVYLFQIKNYNAHNQFLQFGLYSGILGMLFFLYYLFMLIINNKKNKIFICLIIFWVLCFMSESIFERQMGTLLFFFSINIFRNHE